MQVSVKPTQLSAKESENLSSVIVEPLTFEDALKREKEWDDLVDHSYNGTLFHKLSFLRYHPTDRFPFRFLLFRENNHHRKPIAALPYMVKDQTILRSPVGASYGGLVVRKGKQFHEIQEVLSSFMNWATENGFREVSLTHAPSIYFDHMSQDLDFLLMYNGYKISSTLVSSAIDLNWVRSLAEPMESVSSKQRYSIRASQKAGVQVEMSDDLDSYYEILCQNKAKHDSKPAHTLEELKKLRRMFPDHFQLFSIVKDEKMIAGIYTFHVNPKVLLVFYIASLPEFQKYGPVQRGMFEVVSWACSKGYQWVDIGVSADTTSSNPMEPSWNLIFFKEHTGAKGYLRPTYSWKASAACNERGNA